MATLIEILSHDEKRVTAAFYYPVAVENQHAGANDQTREPRGKTLSATDIQDVKDGKVIERIVTNNIQPGQNAAQIAAALVQNYNDLQQSELDKYKDEYQHVGKYYDGTTWTS